MRSFVYDSVNIVGVFYCIRDNVEVIISEVKYILFYIRLKVTFFD